MDHPGIGKTLVDKTKVLVETGSLPQLEKLRSEVPDVVLSMARIPGLGEKSSGAAQRLKLKTLDDLRRACEQDAVKVLKGFVKTQQVILDGLEIAEAAAERIYWAKGDQLAVAIGQHMHDCEAITKMEWAGSYRRSRDDCDLDLLWLPRTVVK